MGKLLKRTGIRLLSFFCACCISACKAPKKGAKAAQKPVAQSLDLKRRVAEYAPVKLTADLSQLRENQRQMLPILIRAAQIMDELFWYQAYGEKRDLSDTLTDPDARRFVQINYGPWDRLRGNAPFLSGVGSKPLGANFYPVDMTKQEFEKLALEGKDGQYSLIRRDAQGALKVVPYHERFAPQLDSAAQLLNQAAALASDPGFKRYLRLRAKALRDDDYYPSDLAWMDMKHNDLDLVIGPIEDYEDRLFGYRAAYEAYVLVKDKTWSRRLAKFAQFLPELQRNLPVPARYKQEEPGSDADLNAYDVVYYAGDCNAGGKTIAINLPNDERVQLKRGTRRLQLKNAMRAKFDKIMLPITRRLITAQQRAYVNFDAFFENTMFHEVAHGLGIKRTLDGKGTVREALKEKYAALEEGKADVLGVYMVRELLKKGQLQGDIKANLVTFLAGIFRSVRFGASSAHGLANTIRFNYFEEKGAFHRTPRGFYEVDFDQMKRAVQSLSALILELQGDGDYRGVQTLVKRYGAIGPTLRADLTKVDKAGIPRDVVFEQGIQVLGL